MASGADILWALSASGQPTLQVVNALVRLLGDLDSPKACLAGAAAPGVDDDETGGWEPGSIWVYSGTAYVCVDATEGAAVWTAVGSGGGGDVVGPDGATDGAIPLYDGVTGKLIKDSGVTLGLLAFYAEDPANHSGLDYAYLAGVVRNDNAVITTPADVVTLYDDTTNYVEVDPATGAVSANTTGYTSGRVPMAEVVTASGAITTVTPARTWAGNEGIALKVPEGAVLQVGDQTCPTTSEIRFGDGTYVRLYEPNDDELAIDSNKLTLNASQLALPNIGGNEGDVLALDAGGLWNPVAPGGGGWDGDIADINLDGGTDIGAALTDADLILVDDGAGGTNRKCAMSRVSTYVKKAIEHPYVIRVYEPATALATGDGKQYITIPIQFNGMNLIRAHAAVYTVSSSGTPTIQIARIRGANTNDMLSTRITIDASELTSYTAATAPVIDGTYDDVATGDLLRIDVDVTGTGTKGLDIHLGFQEP
jgi:hypothetical protein